MKMHKGWQSSTSLLMRKRWHAVIDQADEECDHETSVKKKPGTLTQHLI